MLIDRTMGFSHFFLESLTRLAVVAPFLRAHPAVRVGFQAGAWVRPFVEAFGIAGDRIATLPGARARAFAVPHARAVWPCALFIPARPVCARRVYAPEPTMCAGPTQVKLLMLQVGARPRRGQQCMSARADARGGRPASVCAWGCGIRRAHV